MGTIMHVILNLTQDFRMISSFLFSCTSQRRLHMLFDGLTAVFHLKVSANLLSDSNLNFTHVTIDIFPGNNEFSSNILCAYAGSIEDTTDIKRATLSGWLNVAHLHRSKLCSSAIKQRKEHMQFWIKLIRTVLNFIDNFILLAKSQLSIVPTKSFC